MASCESGGGRGAEAAGPPGEGAAAAPAAHQLPPRGGDARGPVPADRCLREAGVHQGHQDVPHPPQRRREVQVRFRDFSRNVSGIRTYVRPDCELLCTSSRGGLLYTHEPFPSHPLFTVTASAFLLLFHGCWLACYCSRLLCLFGYMVVYFEHMSVFLGYLRVGRLVFDKVLGDIPRFAL